MKNIKDNLSLFWPIYMILVVFVGFSVYAFIDLEARKQKVLNYSGPTAFEEIDNCNKNSDCKIIVPARKETNPKEECIDRAITLFMAYRCKWAY